MEFMGRTTLSIERLALGGEFAIYPGHPVTIAYIIMSKYKNLEMAQALALGNNDIPGAGGRVNSALRLLQERNEGKGLMELFEWADSVWNSERFRDHKKGQEQADKVKPLLAVAEWRSP